MFIYCTNKEKFYKYILNNEPFVLFFANWCSFCLKFKPIFESYIKKNENKLFIFIELENKKKNEIAIEQKINSIPTLIYYKDGKIYKKLNDFSKKGLEEFGKIK